MKNIFRYLLACGCFTLVVAIAVAQTDPSGHWEGTIDVPNGPTRLALDLAKNEKGVWVASLGVPEQKITGLRVSGVSVEGGKVRLEAPDPFNQEFVAAEILPRPAHRRAIRRCVMNPDPLRFGPDGIPHQQLFDFAARHRTVPPRANRNERACNLDSVTVHKHLSGFDLVQPFANSFVGG